MTFKIVAFCIAVLVVVIIGNAVLPLLSFPEKFPEIPPSWLEFAFFAIIAVGVIALIIWGGESLRPSFKTLMFIALGVLIVFWIGVDNSKIIGSNIGNALAQGKVRLWSSTDKVETVDPCPAETELRLGPQQTQTVKRDPRCRTSTSMRWQTIPGAVLQLTIKGSTGTQNFRWEGLEDVPGPKYRGVAEEVTFKNLLTEDTVAWVKYK